MHVAYSKFMIDSVL